MLLTIFTPTYNRAKELKKCFSSLLNQEVVNFKWIIVDDGSTDSTKETVEIFKEANPKFEIQYYYKTNGGKHTAWNYVLDKLDTELVFVVDSDDILTKDATKKIASNWKKYGRDPRLCGMIFLRGYDEKKVIGTKFPITNESISYFDIMANDRIFGDKAEVFKVSIFKQYKFKEYSNEKFQGEGVVLVPISLNYNILAINEIIYITSYLEGGLTKSGRKLRIESPYGGMDGALICMNKRFPLKLRIKSSILFNCYANFAKLGRSIRIKQNNQYKLIVIISYIPGYLLYLYWKKKYS